MGVTRAGTMPWNRVAGVGGLAVSHVMSALVTSTYLHRMVMTSPTTMKPKPIKKFHAPRLFIQEMLSAAK